jgi:hypothetical protein
MTDSVPSGKAMPNNSQMELSEAPAPPASYLAEVARVLATGAHLSVSDAKNL